MLFHLPTDNEEFIKALNSFINTPPRKVERDYSGDNIITEGKYGGIWIDDRQEYANFVSAVNNHPFEEDGEGIVFTDNYFYAYYRNIEGQATPFVSVYMNKYESQDVVNQVNQELKNVRTGERIKKYIDTAISGAWRKQSQNNDNNGDNSGTSNRRRDGVLGSYLLRTGGYYDHPEFYVKTSRANINEYDDIDTSEEEADYYFSLRQPTTEEMADIKAEREAIELGVWERAEERRATLAEATEDVARDDQIFILYGAEVAEMGSRVQKKMINIKNYFNDRELNPTQQTIVDVFSGKVANASIVIPNVNNRETRLILRQGNENNAGVKHSLFRHYMTSIGYYTAEEILNIPIVMQQGTVSNKTIGDREVFEYKLAEAFGGCIYSCYREEG